MKISNAIARFVESHAFQLTAQVLTVAGLLLAAYVTSRLAPLSSSLAEHDFRIKAIETRNGATEPLIERFLVVETQEQNTRDDIEEIKGGMKELNQKIDRVLEKL